MYTVFDVNSYIFQYPFSIFKIHRNVVFYTNVFF